MRISPSVIPNYWVHSMEVGVLVYSKHVLVLKSFATSWKAFWVKCVFGRLPARTCRTNSSVKIRVLSTLHSADILQENHILITSSNHVPSYMLAKNITYVPRYTSHILRLNSLYSSLDSDFTEQKFCTVHNSYFKRASMERIERTRNIQSYLLITSPLQTTSSVQYIPNLQELPWKDRKEQQNQETCADTREEEQVCRWYMKLTVPDLKKTWMQTRKMMSTSRRGTRTSCWGRRWIADDLYRQSSPNPIAVAALDVRRFLWGRGGRRVSSPL